MKKLYILAFALFAILSSFAQAPIIYGTFLPVNGTQVREIWDSTTNILPMPVGGTSPMTWDYSTSFSPSVSDTLRTSSPSTVASYKIPVSASKATNSVFVRAIQKAVSADSLDLFYKLDYTGFYTVGAYDEKTTIAGYTKLTNNPYEVSKPELVVPFEVTYPLTPVYDTMVAQSTFNINLFGSTTVTHKLVRTKIMSSEGYGVLKTPGGTFNNVILTKEIIIEYDSVFSGGVLLTAFTSDYTRCNFLRNNTFASTVLMFIQDNDGDNKADMAWYTLPLSFGSISGTVKDSSGTALTAGTNEVWLYREFSNFFKNDVLAKTTTDVSGNYKFDSIPYGYYRIAIRPDTLQYPNSVTTYYGDTSLTSSGSWMNGDSINTIGCQCDVTGKDVKIKYHAPQTSSVTLSGSLNTTFPFVNMPRQKTGGGKNENMSVMATNDVRGIDIIIKKKPSGTTAMKAQADGSGNFNLTNLNPGNYDVFVDIPGLAMEGTYAFTVTGGSVINCLDYTVNPDSIKPTNSGCSPLSVIEYNNGNASVTAYPNPYSTNTQLTLQLNQKTTVVIEVYNNLGQKVASLENANKQAGSYVYQLTDEQTKTVGIYFIRIMAGDEYKTLKIIRE